MGKKNKGRAPKIQIDAIHKLIRVEVVEKYNKSPDTVRIYFDKSECTLIAVDTRYEKFQFNSVNDDIYFVIGGTKNKKDKLNQTDLIRAINDELEYRFYIVDDIYNEY